MGPSDAVRCVPGPDEDVREVGLFMVIAARAVEHLASQLLIVRAVGIEQFAHLPDVVLGRCVQRDCRLEQLLWRLDRR